MILSRSIAEAMVLAEYEKLDDGSYGGRIPVCPGFIAFAPILAQCQQELQSVLEDWIVLGLKMGHSLPVINSWYSKNIDWQSPPIPNIRLKN